MYEQRNFMIFNTSELDKINFEEVLETSAETVRKSVDGTMTFVKWDGEETPQSIQSLTTKQGPYSYNEIIEILNGPLWTNSVDTI